MIGVDTESSKVVQQTPHPLFYLPPDAARAPIISPNITLYTLRQSRVLDARHKSRWQDPPPALSRLNVLASLLHNGVQMIGNQEVGAVILSPTDAASQEAVVD